MSVGGGDIAYHYTPAVNEFVTISTCSTQVTGFFTNIGVYDANNFVPGAELWCDQFRGTCAGINRANLKCISLVGGTTYCIVLDALNGGGDAPSLKVERCCQKQAIDPPNDVVITMDGDDAVLSWSPVANQQCITAYIVYYSEHSEGPFFYHGNTQGLSITYRHIDVATFSQAMYYRITSYTAPLAILNEFNTKSDARAPLMKETLDHLVGEAISAY